MTLWRKRPASLNHHMKTITIRRLELQFDADQITSGRATRQADQAVDLINLVLQREPFGLGAQLFLHRDEVEIESSS
jgi:hypothetical protein